MIIYDLIYNYIIKLKHLIHIYTNSMSFHKNNEPYSFQQLTKIFYNSNCDLTDIPIKCIEEFSQLPYKITIQINSGNNLNKTFYSSISSDEISNRFNNLLNNMTIEKYVELKDLGHIDTLASFDKLKNFNNYYTFWDEDDYVPPLVYVDIKYNNLDTTIKLINCYLQCANYYKNFVFEELYYKNIIYINIC